MALMEAGTIRHWWMASCVALIDTAHYRLADFCRPGIGGRPVYATRGGELPIAIDLDKTGIANTQQSLHFLDRLCDHVARLAGFKLVL